MVFSYLNMKPAQELSFSKYKVAFLSETFVVTVLPCPAWFHFRVSDCLRLTGL